jgi:probable selenium-dependent hydroxylase accessory protein YqeC
MAVDLMQIFESSGIVQKTYPITFSLTGGGGKTSLLYHCTSSWEGRGEQGICLTTTTTRMFDPELTKHPFSSIQRYDTMDVRRLGTTPYIYQSKIPESGKVNGLTPKQVGMLGRLPRVKYILCESDGSRQRPLKVPNSPVEPVHPDKTDVVLAVVGLSCLGDKVSEQTVHRLPVLRSISSSETIDADLIAQLTLDPRGLFCCAPESSTKILILNQADCIDQLQLQRLMKVLAPEALGVSAVLICTLKPVFKLIHMNGAYLHG